MESALNERNITCYSHTFRRIFFKINQAGDMKFTKDFKAENIFGFFRTRNVTNENLFIIL